MNRKKIPFISVSFVQDLEFPHVIGSGHQDYAWKLKNPISEPTLKIPIFLLMLSSFLIFFYSFSFSNELWINYTNNSTITTLVIEGNYLWQGSCGGAVRRNLNDPLNDVFYYNHAKGLAANGVGFIEIDHLGRKWFATNGVTVWDGTTSITYDTLNSGIVSNYPKCLAEDKSGQMWISSPYGVNVFDGTNWITYDTSNSGLPTNGVGDVAVDDSNRVWLALWNNKGVCMFDGVNWTIYDKSNSGLINNNVFKIVIEPPNKVWFACIGGVSVFDGTNWTSYDTSNSGLASANVSSIAIDSLGRKWFGGCCGGLSMFDGVNWVVYDTLNSGLPSNNVGSIVIDSSGNLWMSAATIETDPKVFLTKFDGTNWFVYDISGNQLPENRVTDIAIDRFDNKWIGTREKGLCKFDDHNWIIYNTQNSGILGNAIGCLACDTSENLLIMSEGGLSKFDGTNWTNYDYDYIPTTGGLGCPAVDKNNVKWFGSMFDGLLKFDDTSWTFYDTSNSPLPDNWVISVAVDSSNNLWVGTMGKPYQGLFGWLLKFDGANWTVYNPSNSDLPWNYAVWSLAVDAQNRIWIGVWGIGIAMFDGANWYNYNIWNSAIASNYVNDIGFDPSGNTWCATEGEIWIDIEGNSWIVGGGVSKFDGINWVTYNPLNSGLADVQVKSVAIDSKGNKWFGTYEDGVSLLGIPTEVVEEPSINLPKEFALGQNYPNPFNPSTTIPFTVYGSQLIVHNPIHTTLTIYNILGQKVRALVDEEKEAGNYNVIWDGKDNSGKEVGSGIYFYQLKTNDYTDTKKMLLLK